MSTAHPVGLGDLLRAQAVPQVSPEEAAAVLGFAPPAPAAPSPPPAPTYARTTLPPPGGSAAQRPAGLSTRPPPTGPQAPARLPAHEPLHVSARPRRRERTDWLEGATLVDLGGHLATQRPPHTPLFAPRRERSLLTGASRCPALGGLDLRALQRALSQGRTLSALPRRLRWAVPRRLTVLADLGASMALFAEDVRALVRQVVALFGRDRVEARYFDGEPTQGAGPGRRSAWRPWLPRVPAESLVLVLGELGVLTADGAQVERWRAHARAVRAGGGFILALVPAPPDRLPRRLTQDLPCLCWDRATRTSEATIIARGRRR